MTTKTTTTTAAKKTSNTAGWKPGWHVHFSVCARKGGANCIGSHGRPGCHGDPVAMRSILSGEFGLPVRRCRRAPISITLTLTLLCQKQTVDTLGKQTNKQTKKPKTKWVLTADSLWTYVFYFNTGIGEPDALCGTHEWNQMIQIGRILLLLLLCLHLHMTQVVDASDAWLRCAPALFPVVNNPALGYGKVFTLPRCSPCGLRVPRPPPPPPPPVLCSLPVDTTARLRETTPRGTWQRLFEGGIEFV